MDTSVATDKQNLTIRLRKETIHKAKMLAARQSTSISALVEQQVERLVEEDDAYEQAMKRSLALMRQGFHLGGIHRWDRDSLHDRKAARES